LAGILAFEGSLKAQFYIKILGYSADTIYPKLINANTYQKMEAFNRLAFFHSFYNVDSAMYYAGQSLKLAEAYRNLNEKAFALRNMGNALSLAGNYRQAVLSLSQAMNIYEALGDPRKIIEIYYDLGLINYSIEDYSRSLIYVYKILEILDTEAEKGAEIVTPLEMAVLLGSSGIVAREIKDYDLAISFFKQYIELSRQIEISDDFHRHWVKSMAESYAFAGAIDSALKYTIIAQSLFLQNKNVPLSQHTGYESSLGGIYLKQGETDKALNLITKAYQTEIQNRSFYYAAGDAISLGDIYHSKKQIDSALYWYNAGFTNAAQLFLGFMAEKTDFGQQQVYSGYQYVHSISKVEIRERYYSLMKRLHKKVSVVYKSAGDPAKALLNHEIMVLYSDSLSTLLNNSEERKMQVRFETERTEQQLDLLEKNIALKESRLRNNRLIFGGVILFLVFTTLVVYLFFRQRRIREARNKLLLEQRLLRSQMNPHFIFNALSGIQSFIVGEEPDKASFYLTGFSTLVRSVLNSSDSDYITLENELKAIDSYLSLQRVRYPAKFDYSIDVDPLIEPEYQNIPPMLAQPFIENAIEHGVKHLETKGKVTVTFRLNHSFMILEIEDNGVGRKKAGELLLKRDKNHKSMATIITRERIAALNRRTKKKITLEIVDLKDEANHACGTRVVFEIPIT
jgi:tetratricopeptide (TPR) repeat protein